MVVATARLTLGSGAMDFLLLFLRMALSWLPSSWRGGLHLAARADGRVEQWAGGNKADGLWAARPRRGAPGPRLRGKPSPAAPQHDSTPGARSVRPAKD